MAKIKRQDIQSIYKELNKNFLNENRKKGSGSKDLPVEKKGKRKPTSKGESIMGRAEKGPQEADGFQSPEEADDRYNAKAKPTKTQINKESPDIFTSKGRKNIQNDINTSMSVKSLFDKLYEEVMDDEDVLGIDGEDDAGEFEDFGADGDEVTVTLPRDIAEQLCDALMGQLDEGEDEDDMDDTEEGDDENPFGEGVDFETVPEVSPNSDMGRQVAAHKDLVSSGDGDGSYTDDVGEDGDYGHTLVNPKKGRGGKEDMKNQKVKAKRGSTPNSQAFGK